MKKNVAVLYHRKNGRPSTECKEVKIEIKEGMFVKMNLREIDVRVNIGDLFASIADLPSGGP